MMARPSSPSVKFTALLVPTMTKKASATKPHTPSGMLMVLKNGIKRSALGGSSVEKPLLTQRKNSCTTPRKLVSDTLNAR